MGKRGVEDINGTLKHGKWEKSAGDNERYDTQHDHSDCFVYTYFRLLFDRPSSSAVVFFRWLSITLSRSTAIILLHITAPFAPAMRFVRCLWTLLAAVVVIRVRSRAKKSMTQATTVCCCLTVVAESIFYALCIFYYK